LSIFSISTVFSQNANVNDGITENKKKLEIGYFDLFAGGAFGYVDGFAGGGSISFLHKNVLYTLCFVSDNKQGGLEYVDDTVPISLNYYKHYRIDNIPIMIGMYRSFRGASLSASAGLSLCMYSEYVDLNTFSIFNSNATVLYTNNTIGFPYEFNLKFFNKKAIGFDFGYGLKLFGNLGKYNYTGLALVVSVGNYK
jgi:hypothetical protein